MSEEFQRGQHVLDRRRFITGGMAAGVGMLAADVFGHNAEK